MEHTTPNGDTDRLSPKEVQADVQTCTHGSCLNKFTPYVDADGRRFCKTHGK